MVAAAILLATNMPNVMDARKFALESGFSDFLIGIDKAVEGMYYLFINN